MKIDHRKSNRSIDINRYQLVNWYWSIDDQSIITSISINLQCLFGYYSVWKSHNPLSSISNINRLIVIDWYRLASILIDWQFHRSRTPGINGVNSINEPATEAVSIGNTKLFRAKLRTLLHMSIELSPKQLGLPNRDCLWWKLNCLT